MSERDHAAQEPGAPEPVAPEAQADASSTAKPTGEREEGSVRRPLIRATLKPPEGVAPPPRQAPVFTMHEQPRGGTGNRGNSRPRSNRTGRDNGHPNKTTGKPRGSRSSRRGRGRSR